MQMDSWEKCVVKYSFRVEITDMDGPLLADCPQNTAMQN